MTRANVLIGQAIARARLKSGRSMHDIAARAGVSVSHLCRIEAGERQAGPEVLSRLAKAIHDPEPMKVKPSRPKTGAPARVVKKVENRIEIFENRATILVGMVLPSRANARLHWSAAHPRYQAQRELSKLLVEHVIAQAKWKEPSSSIWQIQLYRFGPKKFDSDNNVAAFKSVRDGIADAIGIDDSDDERLKWEYQQAVSDRYGVQIWLRKMTTGEMNS